MRAWLLCSLLVVLVTPPVAVAQWQLDGTILSLPPAAVAPSVVADGSGGAITVWTQAGATYAQRVDASGTALWTAGGVEVCASNGFGGTTDPRLWPDGMGGAFITWRDGRNLLTTSQDIYAQRVDAAGAPQWTANGVQLSTSAFGEDLPAVVAAGSGGAIVMWRGNFGDIFAQGLNAAGSTLWAAGGVNIGAGPTVATNLELVPDGAGGAVVAWSDARLGILDLNIYAQRVDGSGASLWLMDGEPLCTVLTMQILNDLALDADGSAIATWTDPRAGGIDIYVQKVDGAGDPQWTADGVAVCLAVGDQGAPVVCSDGFGGAIVAWHDPRTGVFDIAAQRVNQWGTPQWAVDGIGLCIAAGDQTLPTIASDGGGGAIVAWSDGRVMPPATYALGVTLGGFTGWTLDGVPVSVAPGAKSQIGIASDNAGGAIVAWLDGRPSASGVYAQRITYENGLWGRPEAVITSVADVPNDQGGRVRVNWEASTWDVRGYTEIEFYSVWRATQAFPMANLPEGSLVLDDPSRVGADFAGSAYWVEPTTAGEPYYWEWIGNQAVLNSPGYAFSAATRADSTAMGDADHFFQVVAHTDDPYVFWPSNVATGTSVDNLAPAAPLQLTAQRLTTNGPAQGNAATSAAPGDVLLSWLASGESDLRDYSIYRSTANDVQATPAFFIAGTTEDSYLDTTAPTGQSYYYVLTATDVHGNASAATGTVSVGPSTNVGRTPTVSALTVLPNHPNPFSSTTSLEIGLARAGAVSLEVFDVAGRRVAEREIEGARAGWQRLVFDGRDDAGRPLASGVYFYRVSAPGEKAVTRKMVVRR
jgi:hypothetical protein